MFSNDFSEEQVIGLFNTGHNIVIIVYLLLAFLLAYKLRKISTKAVKWIIFGVTCCVCVAEFLKDFDDLKNLSDVSSYMQLAFCSLFIPALLISFIKYKHIMNAGMAYLVIGGLIGGVFYITMPNGSIDTYPIYHIKALHGLIFHFLMVFISLLCMFTHTVIPEKKYFKYYFSFISFFTLVAIFINYKFGCKALFLNNPCGVPVLEAIFNYSPILFAILVYIGESVVAFWLVYFIYNVVSKIINRRIENKTSMKES